MKSYVLLRADPFDGRDRTLEHVVATLEFVRALEGDDVARVLHHTEQRRVTPVVEAGHTVYRVKGRSTKAIASLSATNRTP